MHWNDGWGMMGGGWLMWLLLLIVIGLVVWMFVRASGSGSTGNQATYPPNAARETPTEILQGRYARGEITKEEYEQMRRDLEQ